MITFDFSDPKNIIGHGKKLRLVKVDRWDNGVYYCSANVHAKESSGLDKGSSEKRHTAIHLEVAAPRVSSNLDVIKDLGLDTKSLENLRSTLHSSTSTISSSLHVVESSILGKKDALHKNNVLNQHAVFGDLGSSMSMSCKVSICGFIFSITSCLFYRILHRFWILFQCLLLLLSRLRESLFQT